MSIIDPRIAAHPLRDRPYDKIVFDSLNQHRVPVYRVEGCAGNPTAAPQALARAFAKYGGKCFYCTARLTPELPGETVVSRDHVRARSKGGLDLLHNLVLACRKCDQDKGADLIHDYRPKAAKAYLEALEKHIARCVAPIDDARS